MLEWYRFYNLDFYLTCHKCTSFLMKCLWSLFNQINILLLKTAFSSHTRHDWVLSFVSFKYQLCLWCFSYNSLEKIEKRLTNSKCIKGIKWIWIAVQIIWSGKNWIRSVVFVSRSDMWLQTLVSWQKWTWFET